MRIKSLKARQILNGSGHPTLEVEASTSRNTVVSSVPVASTKSQYEFHDIYDKYENRYNEDSLAIVIDNVNSVIGPELIGKNSMDQELIDNLLLELDGTYDRSKFGVNTLAAISQSIAELGSIESELPLFKYIRVLYDFTGNPPEKLDSTYEMPVPVLTLLSYFSSHSNLVKPVQEIMLLPIGKFSYLHDLISLFSKLQEFDIDYNSNLYDTLDKINKFLKKKEIKAELGIDFASSRFYRKDESAYVMPDFKAVESNFRGDFKKLLKLYKDLSKHNVYYLEDPFYEEDYSAWKELTDYSRNGDIHLDIVSDDLTATNVERLTKVGMLGASNHVSVKTTQIGTVTESIHFVQNAKKYDMDVTVSYRKGESEATFISDLAVGVGASYIRTGGIVGSEYISKLNRLSQIESMIL